MVALRRDDGSSVSAVPASGPLSSSGEFLASFGEFAAVLLVAVAAFAVAYLALRFALVALAGWAFAGTGWHRHARTAAKVLAFCDGLAVAIGVAGFGAFVGVPLPGLAFVGTGLFSLASLVVRFERAMGTRTTAP